ncbi:MAG: PHP domain-containing protein [Neisseriaceae bacterium]|nr:MAG: PHP domain-containing protein [Neisseriaceae bacterium]
MLNIDLHSHSSCSDGTLTPGQVVARASERGCKVLALTDHDVLLGLPAARKAAIEHGIHFVDGVEVSVSWDGLTIHVVGLNVDPDNAELQQGLASVRSGRMRRAEAMAADLLRAGIADSLPGALAFAGNKDMISRTHFARFLVESGKVKDIKTAFKKYLVKGKPGYVPHQWADLNDVVNWIRNAGGRAVLAHPGRYQIGKARMQRLLVDFKAAGGEAVEVVTSNHTPEHVIQFTRLAAEYELLASCGSDFHGPGEGYADIGRLPDMPGACKPVWHDWAIVN